MFVTTAIRLGLLVIPLVLSALPTAAGDWGASVAATPATPPQAAPGPPADTLQPQMLYLVRSTLLALNDANRTGNYTVLRDLSAPSMRERVTAADLATVFAALRKSNLDLGMAALAAPELDGPPMLDQARRLVLKGEYATQPNRVVFELVFEPVGGHWRLFDVMIATRAAGKAMAAAPRPAAQKR